MLSQRFPAACVEDELGLDDATNHGTNDAANDPVKQWNEGRNEWSA